MDCFAIRLIDDALVEGDENITLSVQLMAASPQQLQPPNFLANIMITDNDNILRESFAEDLCMA